MLMCPTCDEPFTPEHPELCEWCGHEFADGYEVDQPQGIAEESLSPRVIGVIVALLTIGAGLIGYFTFIVR